MCAPKHASMKVPVPPGYDQMWPNCVGLNQCGGCGCAVDMLECVADKEETVTVQVKRGWWAGLSERGD